MTRLAAALAALIAAVSFAAGAVTLEMVPGSAPQTAHAGAWFLQPLSVVVRDDSGAPMAGETVQFSADYTPGGPSVMFIGNGGYVTSDANGLATVSVVAMDIAGDVIMHVIQAQASIVLPPLTIVGTPPTQLAYVSGANQTVYPGSLFGQGFAAKALDANGAAVPYAFVMISDAHLDGWAYSTFDGAFDILGMADANGVATSPRATAGPVLGTGAASICAFNMGCPTFYYTVVARPVATLAEPLQVPPLSLELGSTSVVPFVVLVRDQFGAPMPGAQITFATSPACGSFAGSASATVTADADGHATSPLFTALSSEVYCRVTLDVSPSSSWAWDIYEFQASHVVVGNLPASLSLVPNQPFTLTASFTADGVPIYPPPVSMDITAAPNGASAVLSDTSFTFFDSNLVSFRLRANAKSGKYTITVRRGPAQATVAVDQHGK